MLTKKQLIENIEAMEKQGASQQEVQEYIDSVKKAEKNVPSVSESPKPETGNLLDVGVGIAKGAANTLSGMSSLGQKMLEGTVGKVLGVKPAEKTAGQMVQEKVQPTNTAQKIGFGAEQLGEFFIPAAKVSKLGKVAESGLKGLQMADKYGKAGRIAEGALKLGAKSTLGAAEMGAVTAAQQGEINPEVESAAKLGLAFPVAEKVAGSVLGKINKKLSQKAEQTALQTDLLSKNIPESKIASVELSPSGKVVADKAAKEVIRQGIPEADVALIKTSSSADKAKMLRMLDVRQAQLGNKRVTDRATDVVGSTFLEKVAKPISDLNRDAAKQLDTVARSLAGKKVDTTEPVMQFATSLENAGVRVGKNGKLNFKNSNFEGLPSAQNLIQNVWSRAVRIIKSGDALQTHRTKSYIDEIVNYGKQEAGLSGKAQTMLKQFRHGIDGSLDSKFPAYNQVNTQFAETITEMDKIGTILGKSFKLGDNFADAQSGLAMRRILSNTKSRAEILKLLDDVQKVGKKYGVKYDEDIVTQANFADVLEKMLGTEAPTSLLGQTERAMKGIGGAGADLAAGHPVQATLKAGKYAIDVTRGVSQENAIKALRALLEKEANASNFGRKSAGGAKKSIAKIPTARYNESMQTPPSKPAVPRLK